MMGINMQVALAIDLEIEECVPTKLLQHMIKKTDTGTAADGSLAIKIQAEANRGFGSGAFDCR
jgi:hypothetical protein